MSFTRFYDDPARIVIRNQQATGPGRWVLDQPGNGDKPYYMADPQIRAQQWAGNLWTNCIDLNSALLGLDRNLNKDCLGVNEYNNNKHSAWVHNAKPIEYPTSARLTTEQSRAVLPAWTVRDLEQVDWAPLLANPQQHALRPFVNNVSSRILEKEKFLREGCFH